MATLVSPQLRGVADAIVKKSGYSSAVLSGIAPDPRHLDRGGYHCSVEDLRKHGNAGDYSNTRVDDHDFNVRYGAAVDISLSAADMKKAYARIYRVFADHDDPRRRYVNAINCWDGSGDAVRLDFKTNKVKYASPDHTWHIHGDMPRRYVLDPKAARAWISIFAGEAKATWVAREEKPVPPILPGKPPESSKPPVKPPVKPAPQPSKPPVKPAPKTHKPGTRVLRYVPGKPVLKGEDCLFVQRFIGREKAGRPDGTYGARTRSAVKWYQAMRGLKADGICGAATWRAMGIKNNL